MKPASGRAAWSLNGALSFVDAILTSPVPTLSTSQELSIGIAPEFVSQPVAGLAHLPVRRAVLTAGKTPRP